MHIFNRYFNNVFIINLERDKKRMEKMESLCNRESIRYERVEAIDGKKKEKYNDYITRPCQWLCTNGMIGCALSHYFLWKRVVDERIDKVLVLEDDIFFIDGYKKIFEDAIKELPKDWDLFYLGCHGLCHKGDRKINIFMSLLHLIKNNGDCMSDKKHIFKPKFALTTHCYAITYDGCKKLLEHLNKVSYHIDVSIALRGNRLNVYACEPNIAYQLGDDSLLADRSFPRLLNACVSRIRDNNNFKMDYYLTVPIIRGVNVWTLIFFMMGVIARGNKYIKYLILALFMLELQVNNLNYMISFMMFMVGYCIRK